MNIYIFDIDGVLADIEHRLIYRKRNDFDNFYDEDIMAKDKLISAGKELLDLMNKDGIVVYSTGRPERTRKTTIEWLVKYGFPVRAILMREDNDFRPSPEVKLDHVWEIMKEFRETLETSNGTVYFIDDDPKNVEAVERNYAKRIIKVNGLVYGTKRF